MPDFLSPWPDFMPDWPQPVRVATWAALYGVGMAGLAVLTATEIADDVKAGLGPDEATPAQERGLVFRASRRVRDAVVRHD